MMFVGCVLSIVSMVVVFIFSSDVCLLYIFCLVFVICVFFFFFKQKTAYEMRISDWSSDVCSSDLEGDPVSPDIRRGGKRRAAAPQPGDRAPSPRQIGRASCRERVCQYV